MDKKSVLWIILDSIFIVVFNTVFYVLAGTEHSVSVWLSYGFIHFSYVMVLVTPFLIRKGSSAAVFGFSLYSVSALYFFVEFIVGLIFILLEMDSYKTALVVQIVLAGLYGIILVSNLLANEFTADSVARHESEAKFIKTCASRVEMLIGRVSDKKVAKELEFVYDFVHSSPAKSNPDVHALEADALREIADLEKAVDCENAEDISAVCNRIISIFGERNRLLRLSNK